MRNEMHASDCHFSKVEAARYLGKSTRWLDYQLSGQTPPPGFKIGKCWLFKKSELDHWLEKFRASADLDRLVDETLAEVLGK
jgi:predicted DNA-binding transcriptional regulator AlpA